MCCSEVDCIGEVDNRLLIVCRLELHVTKLFFCVCHPENHRAHDQLELGRLAGAGERAAKPSGLWFHVVQNSAPLDLYPGMFLLYFILYDPTLDLLQAQPR